MNALGSQFQSHFFGLDDAIPAFFVLAHVKATRWEINQITTGLHSKIKDDYISGYHKLIFHVFKTDDEFIEFYT